VGLTRCLFKFILILSFDIREDYDFSSMLVSLRYGYASSQTRRSLIRLWLVLNLINSFSYFSQGENDNLTRYQRRIYPNFRKLCYLIASKLLFLVKLYTRRLIDSCRATFFSPHLLVKFDRIWT